MIRSCSRLVSPAKMSASKCDGCWMKGMARARVARRTLSFGTGSWRLIVRIDVKVASTSTIDRSAYTSAEFSSVRATPPLQLGDALGPQPEATAP